MKFGVLVFPGSNCDHDTYNVIAEIAHQPVTFLWHDSADLQGVDAVLVPGGFAYGDYLRTGAIARFSPVMGAVQKFAGGGGIVLGICNGFQILAESGLLVEMQMQDETRQSVKAILWSRFICINIKTGKKEQHPDSFMQLARQLIDTGVDVSKGLGGRLQSKSPVA